MPLILLLIFPIITSADWATDMNCGDVLAIGRPQTSRFKERLHDFSVSMRRAQRRFYPDAALSQIQSLRAALHSVLPGELTLKNIFDPQGIPTIADQLNPRSVSRAEGILEELLAITNEAHGEDSEETARVLLARTLVRPLEVALVDGRRALEIFKAQGSPFTALVQVHFLRLLTQELRQTTPALEMQTRYLAAREELNGLVDYLPFSTLRPNKKSWPQLNSLILNYDLDQWREQIEGVKPFDETDKNPTAFESLVQTVLAYPHLGELLREGRNGSLARLINSERRANFVRQTISGPQQALIVKRTILLANLERSLQKEISVDEFVRALREMHFRLD